MTQIATREEMMAKPLIDFFTIDVNFKIFMDVVVNKTRNIPLRLLDWFVTNYAKKYYIKTLSLIPQLYILETTKIRFF